MRPAQARSGAPVIAGVVSCPQPPLLLPGLTGRPVAEVEQLRTACRAAIADLLGGRPDAVVLIGGLAADEVDRPDEPISLRVGRQLLAEAGCAVPIRPVRIRADAPTEECLIIGRQLTAATEPGQTRPGETQLDETRPSETQLDETQLGDTQLDETRPGETQLDETQLDETPARPGPRLGLLVMADGSARRGLKAPGYLDPRAAPYDQAIERALTGGDPSGLAMLDADLAAELLVAGRAAWQVLAGATERCRFASQVHYLGDPFGVWYPVVSWQPAGLRG